MSEYQSSRDWGQAQVNPTEDYCARLLSTPAKSPDATPNLARLAEFDALLTDYRNSLLSGAGVMALEAYSALIKFASADYLQNKAYCLGRRDERDQVNRVDWLGLALDLEKQARLVESQTAERAMLAAAHGLRLIGAGAA